MNVIIKKEKLDALLAMADAYLEDISSGLVDGTYDQGSNEDFPEKLAVAAEVTSLIAATVKACGESSAQVKHSGCYDIDGTVLTHQIDLTDVRDSSGQVRVTIGALEGDLDEMIDVMVEVGTNPLTGIEQLPCVHVHFDSDNLAFSLFKLNDRILLIPETGVEVNQGLICMNDNQNKKIFWAS